MVTLLVTNVQIGNVQVNNVQISSRLISQQIERSSTLLLVSSQLLEEVCVGEANGIDDVVVDDEPDDDGEHSPDEGVVDFFWKSAAALE